jgi:hypothetical protein
MTWLTRLIDKDSLSIAVSFKKSAVMGQRFTLHNYAVGVAGAASFAALASC